MLPTAAGGTGRARQRSPRIFLAPRRPNQKLVAPSPFVISVKLQYALAESRNLCMSIARSILKANQRRLLLNRRSIFALKAGRGRVYCGMVDLTASTVSMWQEANRSLLWANSVLRK